MAILWGSRALTTTRGWGRCYKVGQGGAWLEPWARAEDSPSSSLRDALASSLFLFSLFRDALVAHGWDLSFVCNLHHSPRILNPLSKARDRTGVLMDTSWFVFAVSQWELQGCSSFCTENRTVEGVS